MVLVIPSLVVFLALLVFLCILGVITMRLFRANCQVGLTVAPVDPELKDGADEKKQSL